MSVYYSVRSGHNPGIYKTWKECKKEISNFKRSEFKKFKNYDDALNYLGNVEQERRNEEKKLCCVDCDEGISEAKTIVECSKKCGLIIHRECLFKKYERLRNYDDSYFTLKCYSCAFLDNVELVTLADHSVINDDNGIKKGELSTVKWANANNIYNSNNDKEESKVQDRIMTNGFDKDINTSLCEPRMIMKNGVCEPDDISFKIKVLDAKRENCCDLTGGIEDMGKQVQRALDEVREIASNMHKYITNFENKECGNLICKKEKMEQRMKEYEQKLEQVREDNMFLKSIIMSILNSKEMDSNGGSHLDGGNKIDFPGKIVSNTNDMTEQFAYLSTLRKENGNEVASKIDFCVDENYESTEIKNCSDEKDGPKFRIVKNEGKRNINFSRTFVKSYKFDKLYIRSLKYVLTIDEIKEKVEAIVGEKINYICYALKSRNDLNAFCIEAKKEALDLILDKRKWGEDIRIRPFKGELNPLAINEKYIIKEYNLEGHNKTCESLLIQLDGEDQYKEENKAFDEGYGGGVEGFQLYNGELLQSTHYFYKIRAKDHVEGKNIDDEKLEESIKENIRCDSGASSQGYNREKQMEGFIGMEGIDNKRKDVHETSSTLVCERSKLASLQKDDVMEGETTLSSQDNEKDESNGNLCEAEDMVGKELELNIKLKNIDCGQKGNDEYKNCDDGPIYELKGDVQIHRGENVRIDLKGDVDNTSDIVKIDSKSDVDNISGIVPDINFKKSRFGRILKPKDNNL